MIHFCMCVCVRPLGPVAVTKDEPTSAITGKDEQSSTQTIGGCDSGDLKPDLSLAEVIQQPSHMEKVWQ